MSRIGKLPVSVPGGVTITVGENNLVTVKGPKGTLSEKISPEIKIEEDDGVLHITRPSDDKRHRALHGLSRTLINNMVVGITDGFEKKLEIVGVGYRAQMQGKKLILNLGYSNPVEYEAPNGIELSTDGPNKVSVKGIDKQSVGQVAAIIRGFRPPEPYLGKGVKYANEFIIRKAGKTGAK